jgi:uncharacterized membrane protein
MYKKLIYILSIIFVAMPFIINASEEIYKAEVLNIVSSEQKEVEGLNVFGINQVITVKFLEGPETNSQATFLQDKLDLKKGEIIFIEKTDQTYKVLEKNRMPMIWGIIILFFILIFLLNGFQGVKSILGLGISFVLIIFVLLPLIIFGINPLIVSIIIGGIILSIVLFLSHGFNKGSVIALVGTVGAIIFAGILSLLVSIWMRLTGMGDDMATTAMITTNSVIDFADLLLAGIIIGMLGVLDDIAITQVAVVSEIKNANQNLKPVEVFTRALRVGKEHVSALVNTLVLAYTGASFPLLILLYQSGIRLDMLLSQEIVATEIVRTIIGSIGLIVAVPLTTYLAARFLKTEDKVESHCAHTHH